MNPLAPALLSTDAPPGEAGAPDRLSALLARFHVRASLFHEGPLCGRTRFDERDGHAFLHLLRRGELIVEHPRRAGLPATLRVDEPSLLLYPRAQTHTFVNPPREGADFTCATLHFEGGAQNPLVNALPAVVCVPLREVPGLRPTLDVLFAETAAMRCGSRLLADRLFEVVLIQLLRWLLDHPERAGVGPGLLAALADPKLARALVALHRAPEDEWTLPRMAQQAGMSRSAFAAAFKVATGVTPAAYLGEWRLSLACTRLRAGHPIKQIAADLGYANASTLSKAFKQRFGASPRHWLDAT